MSCEVCDYWAWRLKDMRLSRDKAAEAVKRAGSNTHPFRLQGFYEDVSNVLNARREHELTHLDT